jgi:restriction endonuclease S subunit
MTWQLTRLSEFLTEREGRIKFESANALGLQRIKKIDFSGRIHLDTETDTKTDMIRVCDGDLVISGINAAKGAIAVHVGDEDVLATIHYSAYEFNPDRISVEFLKWFFKSPEFALLLKEQVAGGIKTELKAKHILPLQIKLPSLSEQLTIAEKLNLFRIEQLKTEHEISRQESLVKNLRESILDEALQGKLTSGWRNQNSDCEPASELFKRMQRKKAELESARKTRHEKQLAEIKPDEIPFEVPKSWQWCRLGSIIEEKPRNGVSLKPVDYETNAKTLKLSATSSGVFDGTQCKYLDLSVEEDSYLWLRDGDILIQRANSLELVGTAAVYRGGMFEYIYPDLMMKCRSTFEECTDFIHSVLLAKFTRHYYQRNATGAAGNMPKVNQATVMNTLIPLPPMQEQIAIIERVASLTESIRILEEAIASSRLNLKDLGEAVLQETFAQAA